MLPVFPGSTGAPNWLAGRMCVLPTCRHTKAGSWAVLAHVSGRGQLVSINLTVRQGKG